MGRGSCILFRLQIDVLHHAGVVPVTVGDSSNTARDQDRLCRRSYSRAISEEFAPRIGTRGASLNSRSAQTGEGLSTGQCAQKADCRKLKEQAIIESHTNEHIADIGRDTGKTQGSLPLTCTI
jgi:hypothetical protein